MNLDPYGLQKHARSWYSMHGEDGITLYLCNRLQPPRNFVEIGTGSADGPIENNTYVLVQCGWRGIWADPLLKNSKAPRELREVVGFIGEKVEVLDLPKFAGDIGLLSIDVDGNDYWLWKGFPLKPAIVIVECNVERPYDDDYIMPYDPEHVSRPEHTGYGASVSSMIALGKELGYTFVCLAPPSVNAFFVRDDLLSALS